MIGTLFWNRETARAIDRMAEQSARAESAAAAGFSPKMLEGLPAPVARYFTFAITPRRPLVRRARFSQAGEFSISPGVWKPFTAVEYFSVHPPGFIWDATIRSSPLLPVRVRDSYLAGQGAMRGALAGLVPVVDQHGTPEVAAGTLVRYLAETAWLPTAMLPCEGVRWTPIDQTSARATLTDGAISVWLDVSFGSNGEIVTVSTMRYRDVKGTPVLTPWAGHFHDYESKDGMMVPLTGEVEWLLGDERLPYWRGEIVEASYF
jgi:uncharacterized protein DUF6920